MDNTTLFIYLFYCWGFIIKFGGGKKLSAVVKSENSEKQSAFISCNTVTSALTIQSFVQRIFEIVKITWQCCLWNIILSEMSLFCTLLFVAPPSLCIKPLRWRILSDKASFLYHIRLKIILFHLHNKRRFCLDLIHLASQVKENALIVTHNTQYITLHPFI